LTAFFSRTVFERNVLAGGSSSRYPSGNYFPSVADFNAAFANLAGDDLTLVPGSAFRTMGAGGTPVGADVGRVTASVNGASSASGSGSATIDTSTSTGERAVCRQGMVCTSDAAQSSHRRR